MAELKSNEAFIHNARQRAFLSDDQANRLLRLCLDTGQPVAEIVREQCLLSLDDISLIEDSLVCTIPPVPQEGASTSSGQRIGRYIIRSELGRGGMGVVFEAYDPVLKRSLALKVIRPTEVVSQQTERFLREGRALAQLSAHPNIVAIHDMGRAEGSFYIAMDLVKGGALDSWFNEDKSIRAIMGVTHAIARALGHAHALGIVHRDIKPENILMSEAGSPLVSDFGLARQVTTESRITSTGVVIGTPAYMSPEQVLGEDDQLGPASDVFSLGVVAYELLAGKHPFIGKTVTETMISIVQRDPPDLRQANSRVSLDLETIVMKCLSKSVADRYPDAKALEEDLSRLLAGESIEAQPLSQRDKLVVWARRNRLAALALAVMFLAMVGILVGSVAQYRDHQRQLFAAEVEAGRREERARLVAEQEARKSEEAALAEAARRREAEALETLRREVTAVLDRVASGERLVDPNDRRIERSNLLRHHHPETVRLLTAELDALSEYLGQSHQLNQGQELFLRFLCNTLADLSLQEGAVASIGRYLKTELALPENARNQLRAVPAGQALCLLGGEEADRLLLEERDAFGINGSFWDQVQPLYKRTGVEPGLEAETLQGYYNRGLVRSDKGNLDGAIADQSRAIEINPNYARPWSERGHTRYAKGDLDGAIADQSRALELNPKIKAAWLNRGLARKANGDLDGAIADYSRALEIDPIYVNAWYNRGLVRKIKGDLDGAIADYSRALELNLQYAEAWSNRGLVRKIKGDFDGAIADYTRALEIDPKLKQAWLNRGRVRNIKDELDGAIADYSRALEIDPKYVDAWYNRGIVRNAKGDLDGAIADYSRALELNPQYAEASCNRGGAREAKGDLDGAIADWQRFVELAPNHRVAPAIRAKLQKVLQQRAKAGAGQ